MEFGEIRAKACTAISKKLYRTSWCYIIELDLSDRNRGRELAYHVSFNMVGDLRCRKLKDLLMDALNFSQMRLIKIFTSTKTTNFSIVTRLCLATTIFFCLLRWIGIETSDQTILFSSNPCAVELPLYNKIQSTRYLERANPFQISLPRFYPCHGPDYSSSRLQIPLWCLSWWIYLLHAVGVHGKFQIFEWWKCTSSTLAVAPPFFGKSRKETVTLSPVLLWVTLSTQFRIIFRALRVANRELVYTVSLHKSARRGDEGMCTYGGRYKKRTRCKWMSLQRRQSRKAMIKQRFNIEFLRVQISAKQLHKGCQKSR